MANKRSLTTAPNERAAALSGGGAAAAGPFYHAWHHQVPLKLPIRLRLLLAILFLLVGTGIVWAVTVPISGAFMSEGRLVAEGKNRVVDHLEGGIVEEVFVREGDKVKAGDLLARMDVTNASVALANAESQRDVDRIQMVRLLTEQRGDEEIVWPEDLEARIKNDPDLAEAAIAQRKEFASKTQELAALKSILTERINTNTQLVDSLEKLRQERIKRIADTQNEVDLSDQMMKKGLTTRDRNFALKRQLASDQDQLRQTLIQIDDKRSTINESREQLNRTLSQRQNEIADTILKLQAEISQLTEKMRSYRAMANRSDVRAPVAGIVTNVAVNTRNQVIGAGKPLFEIFPSNVPLYVEAKVEPRYIDSVVLGQHVSVQFQSRERTKSRLMLDGNVTYVASDSEQDQRTGRYYYTVRAKLDPESIAQYGDIVPGNLATVYFELDQQTFLQYLVDPYWDMGQKAFVG
ncbi:HlyD family type I secretion periplasmic adaptor subunit [Aurantimonas sp. VKM B-3413]|uniref:HlyD family type I secretion periplasmic adaptor subunit n=1 Tax=Aurantimonas sp. VKM B-3413 TaxID=2779401 RepID=UPI001E30C263|nr:HlyD family type I secretion periplasmic adaptor subunit [Aurantimonas sp. VKM B-3413]MCB8839387.1 HlyD family type I secretion periplasmic adaptor subunit [Aurantimonas sp. VKM B-3413]